MHRIWNKKAEQFRVKKKNFKNFGIYSYRIYSVPLQKNMELKVTARKKVLSPVTSLNSSKVHSGYAGWNKNSGPNQTFLSGKDEGIKKLLVSKFPWAERHFSCYQKSHVRAKSIQDNYLGSKGARRTSLMNTCEISLQTYN